MAMPFYEAVVSSNVDLPLSRRYLIPDGHDGSPMLDSQCLPINTSVEALKTIDKVIFPESFGPGVPLETRDCHA